jgi:thiol-disulfide isomerase/thioredoxin
MDYREKYLKYKNKYNKLRNNLSIQSGGKKKKNTLYLFKASWCGHCIAFKSTWDQLQTDLKNDINFETYDADEHGDIMKKFKIDGYPTLILKKEDQAFEFVGTRDLQGLKDFVNNYN